MWRATQPMMARLSKMPSRPVVRFPEAVFKLRPVTPGETVDKVVFVVPKNLSKPEIQDYLEKIYNLGIKSINTYVAQGKLKQRPKMRGFVRRPDIKKAIVTLEHPWTSPIPPPPPKKEEAQKA